MNTLKKLTMIASFFTMFVSGTLISNATPSESSLIKHFHDKAVGQLTYAALKGNAKKVDAALSAGADINLKGDDGITPIEEAVLKHNKKATLLLLERKANPNSQDNEGFSPISVAARDEKDSWFLETLLQYGGNPRLNNEKRHETLLFNAIDAQNLKNIDILLKAGANINYREDFTKETALDRSLGKYDITLHLLKAGADPTIKDGYGHSTIWNIKHPTIFTDSSGEKERQQVIKWFKQKKMWKSANH